MRQFIGSKAEGLPGIQVQREVGLGERILVVEDNADIRRSNAGVLIHSGYQVDTAEGGTAAWAALQRNRYDLMVTNNHMPEVSGVDLLKKMHAANLKMPVIMATGILPTWEFATFPWLQPNAVLVMPYIPEELLEMVKNILHKIAIANQKHVTTNQGASMIYNNNRQKG